MRSFYSDAIVVFEMWCLDNNCGNEESEILLLCNDKCTLALG